MNIASLFFRAGKILADRPALAFGERVLLSHGQLHVQLSSSFAPQRSGTRCQDCSGSRTIGDRRGHGSFQTHIGLDAATVLSEPVIPTRLATDSIVNSRFWRSR